MLDIDILTGLRELPVLLTADAIAQVAEGSTINLDEWEFHEQKLSGRTFHVITQKNLRMMDC
ncbi:hypothetical protein [Niabella hibiscisoli]|uniref:hypothetical protein n=1 Tax=Niabella hibiscisoli TaxID=1825928 RepID=UPI001F0E05E2|nr:hypothetical protein [Niabella hibiscisoli]MCH5719102.1 hypothetical protein [Niabella hibiscisoli]